jgi:hypothetical protein
MPAQGDHLTYEEFGEAFIFATVTPERVVGAVRRVAGETVSLGPMRAGPAGTATVTARGTIGEPIADEIKPNPLTYSVRLPVSLSIEVRVGAVGRFDASGEIELRLKVRTVRPLAIVIDVERVHPSNVRFAIEAHGMQSRLLQRAGDVEGELREQAARYVNEQTARPEAARYMRIELPALIESAWSSF